MDHSKSIPLETAATTIKYMPTSEAIQLIKSKLTGKPTTQVINDEVVLVLKKDHYGHIR